MSFFCYKNPCFNSGVWSCLLIEKVSLQEQKGCHTGYIYYVHVLKVYATTLTISNCAVIVVEMELLNL